MLLGIIIGFVAGTVTGVFTMGVVSAGRENERLAETYKPDDELPDNHRDEGEWIFTEEDEEESIILKTPYFKCSCCGGTILAEDVGYNPYDFSYHFCPMCGAHMPLTGEKPLTD